MDAAFNTQLLNLIKELQRMYPNDADLSFIRKTVFTIGATYPKKSRTLFGKYIKPYEKHIMEHNESFFLERGADEYLGDGKTDWSGVLIEKLKGMWADMDTDTRHSIWLYLTVLVKLTKR
jgi:hypothetical protein